MMWYVVLAIVLVLLFAPSLLAERSPIPETSGKVHKIQKSEELDTLLKTNKYVIMDAYADWCPPCRAIAPIFSQLADTNAMEGKMAFAKVNVDHVKDIARRYQISAMPSFLFFTDGRPSSMQVTNVRTGRSVILDADGGVERILGADVNALKAVVTSIAQQAKSA